MNGTRFNQDPETRWMLRLQNGDDTALTEILNRYEKAVLNFAYTYVHDAAAAEDVAQDVFLEVYKRRRAYQPTGKLSTWIFTIAAHRCLNLKRAKRQSAEISPDQIDPDQTAAPDALEESERARHFWRLLESLPGNQRAAFLLAKHQNLSLEEVAQILNVTEGAVKQLVHRAKAGLREKLDQPDGETID